MNKYGWGSLIGAILFIYVALSSLGGAFETFAREGGINLVSLGIFGIGLAGFCFFAGIPTSIILWETKKIYLNPYWSCWVYSIGLLLYSLGMFLGSGPYPASIGWGIWLLICSIFFGAMGYYNGFSGLAFAPKEYRAYVEKVEADKE